MIFDKKPTDYGQPSVIVPMPKPGSPSHGLPPCAFIDAGLNIVGDLATADMRRRLIIRVEAKDASLCNQDVPLGSQVFDYPRDNRAKQNARGQPAKREHQFFSPCHGLSPSVTLACVSTQTHRLASLSCPRY